MSEQTKKRVWSVATGLGFFAGFVAIGWMFGDSEPMKAWLATPVRDASIGDVGLLLIAAAIVAK